MLRKTMAVLVTVLACGGSEVCASARGDGTTADPFKERLYSGIVGGYTSHDGRIREWAGAPLTQGQRDVWGHWGKYDGSMIHGP